MKINEVEKQTGISCTNIRYYEQKELLVPQRANDNNYRVYTSDDIERLKQIKILRMIGIPIAEIKEILDEKKSLKDVMTIRIDQITDEEQNLATVKALCKTISDNDMDIHLLNEDLLEENRTLWKKKLNAVNIEEKAQALRRKTAITLCILAIIFWFFPVVATQDRSLNAIQLVLHLDFIWTIGTTISLLLYLLVLIIYIYVLHGHIHYKTNADLLIYPNLATTLGLFSQIMINLVLTIQPPDFITDVMFIPYFLCICGSILRLLTGLLLVIDYASGDELFMRILKKRTK